jgi:glycosyltransferase involved in cell wall biosynthesis
MSLAGSRKRIGFVSTMAGYPWGGSEELWSRAALDLASQGLPVSASVAEWSPLHPRVVALQQRGLDVQLRPRYYSYRRHPLRRILSGKRWSTLIEVERLIAATSPALVVLSDGGALPPVDLLELCAKMQVPFVAIGHCNSDDDWRADEIAARYRAVLPLARRCFFVSEANLRLAEKQIGDPFSNAEVVRNPVNIALNASPKWPAFESADEFRFASVGRLHPPSKGQDILFEALAASQWRERPWRLSLYGEGPMRHILGRLAQRLGIGERVVFAGFAAVEDIWASNHVLVMPSRFEGLPLAMVEAMLCGRPVIATDVAGHREIVQDGITGFLADAPTTASFTAALERFWERRGEARAMGQAGAHRIREVLPPDPVRAFSDKLKQLSGLP